jgi:hypothetical protein
MTTVATVGHVAHTRLLLAPTAVMGHMTSDDCCCCGARGTCTVATSGHNNDGLSDISGPLLLPPKVATSNMTSHDHCYYWARDMRGCYWHPHQQRAVWHQMTVATLGHVAHGQFLLAPIAATSCLTSVGRCYYHLQWQWATWHQMIVATVGHVTRTRLLLAPTIATGPHNNDGLAIHCYWTASSDRLAVHCY